MPETTRSELLHVITRIGTLAPDLRLGQLVALLADRADTPYTANPVSDIEDDELLPAAREFLELLIERSQNLEPQRLDSAATAS